jgi:hypothetical protein
MDITGAASSVVISARRGDDRTGLCHEMAAVVFQVANPARREIGTTYRRQEKFAR